MTDLRLPCQEGNSDDWFIARDGKQYPDEELLTPVMIDEIQDRVDDMGLVGDAKVDAIDRALDRAESDVKREALQRRRHAKEACHDCLLRTRCLQVAIDTDAPSGTWGGYYEEELREIRRQISRRKRGREPRLLED